MMRGEQHSTTGRERAIETLIDMEPHGAYYRAAKVMEEVPAALSARPNLITRAALVDSAHALASYEIENFESYESINSLDFSSTTSQPFGTISADDKARVLRHHAKLVAAKNGGRERASVASPPSLVSAMRRLCESEESRREEDGVDLFPAAELSSLLKAIMSHKIFSGKETEGPHRTSTATESGKEASTEPPAQLEEKGTPLSPANMELMIGNLCRLVSLEKENKDEDEILQGLLIASMSVLTGSINDVGSDEEDPLSDGKEDIKNAGKGKVSNPKKSRTEKAPGKGKRAAGVDSYAAVEPYLLVGSIMSLLPCDTEASAGSTNVLDSETVTYLGKAAAAFEERSEIQKSRILSKLYEDSETSTEHSKPNLRRKFPIVPVTPPPSTRQLDASEGEGLEVVESDDSMPALAPRSLSQEGDENEEPSPSLEVSEHGPRIADLMMSDSTSSQEGFDPAIPALHDPEDLQDESSHDDSTDSGDEDDDDSEASDAYGEEVGPHSSSSLVSGRDRYVADGIDENEDDSSSSTSTSSANDVEADMMINSDDDDDDEEEEDRLRRALELSLEATAMPSEDSIEATPRNLARGLESLQLSVDRDENTEGERNVTHHLLAQDQSNEDNEEAEAGPAEFHPVPEASAGDPASPATDMKDNEDEDDLPKLPSPLKHYPYLSLLELPHNHDDDDVGAEYDAQQKSVPYMSPSEYLQFGALPSTHVLYHFLRCVLSRIEGLVKRQASGDKSIISEEMASTRFAGGVGWGLFSSNPCSDRHGDLETPSSCDAFTLQMLTVSFLMLTEARMQATERLRKVLSKGGIREDSKSPAGDDLEEEDDPAFAIAKMNSMGDAPNVDPDLLSSLATMSMAQSLETKGMRRKAAAAAHDAALREESRRRLVTSLKKHVQLFSECTLFLLKSLRLYVRSTSRASTDVNCSIEPHSLTSPLEGGLASSLSSLMSISLFRGIEAMKPLSLEESESPESDDDEDPEDQTFLHVPLYWEALSAWAGLIHILYPSREARVDVFETLLKDCFAGGSNARKMAQESMSKRSLPRSEHETQCHRLHILCRRLRVSDLLDDFVNTPIIYDPESPDEKRETAAHSSDGTVVSNTLVPFLGTIMSEMDYELDSDVVKLYLALCHRFNLRTLLWNRNQSYSVEECDDELASYPGASSISPADMLRVSSAGSSSLQFDASKCSDSIAILSKPGESSASPNGSSANQRASKVWGTILSTSCFHPKSGVHRWAVRLDKCERGHVFVGVATSQASVKTYVGGDKFGWGVIGTQALWHDRSKIRGDYGATFRTGSTIVVTLDTDAGTLSFGLWKDHSGPSEFSFEASSAGHHFNLASPRSRAGGSSGEGKLEDWGVAFEGLPLDSRLFPAVGLYQRDDRVTLLSVDSGSRSASGTGVWEDSVLYEGDCYYPRQLSTGSKQGQKDEFAFQANVRVHNDLLSQQGIDYVKDIIEHSCSVLEENSCTENVVVGSVLPSVASSLCLLPSNIPVLSVRMAMSLLSPLAKCIKCIDTNVSREHFSTLVLDCTRLQGKWRIRATGTGSSSSFSSDDFEEYIVTLSGFQDTEDANSQFHGFGVGTTGKSKNGHVSIVGNLIGTSLFFVEDWTDGNDEGADSLKTSTPGSSSSASSCVVVARMGLDGLKFEGTYKNVQYGTSGTIAGVRIKQSEDVPVDVVAESSAKRALGGNRSHRGLVQCQSLLCRALTHMASILTSPIARMDTEAYFGKGFVNDKESNVAECDNKGEDLGRWLSRPMFSCGMQDAGGVEADVAESMKQYYSFSLDSTSADGQNLCIPEVFGGQKKELNSSKGDVSLLRDFVQSSDSALIPKSGGKGSLSMLCITQYCSARTEVICALLWHCLDRVTRESICAKRAPSDKTELIGFWNAALRIMEDGLRNRLNAASGDTAVNRRELCAEKCALLETVASFLLKIAPNPRSASQSSDTLLDISKYFASVESASELIALETEMKKRTWLAILRYRGLQEVGGLMTNDANGGKLETFSAFETCALVLPRLFGRESMPSGRTRSTSAPSSPNSFLGSYYLANILGAGSCVQSLVRQCVHSSLQLAGRVLLRTIELRDVKDARPSSLDSLTLSILSLFFVAFDDEDFSEMILDSEILKSIRLLLSRDKSYLTQSLLNKSDMIQLEKAYIGRQIKEIAENDLAKVVLRSSISLSHLIIFQLSQESSSGGSSAADVSKSGAEDLSTGRNLCLSLLFDEFKSSVDLVASAAEEERQEKVHKCIEEEVTSWCDSCVPSESSRWSKTGGTKHRRHVLGGHISGLLYLFEHGSLPSLKASSGKSYQQNFSSGSTSSTSSEYGVDRELIGAPCHSYFTQVLNVLCTSARSSSFLKLYDDARLEFLLYSIGVKWDPKLVAKNGKNSVEVEREDKLPLKYQVRVLRMLWNILGMSKTNQSIVNGLLLLIGYRCDTSGECSGVDGEVVMRESISLLRHLYSPTFPQWRDCIHVEISELFSSADHDERNNLLRLGVLCFFGGGPRAIHIGGYVLLKSAPAAHLSSMTQSSSSSKSHGSGSGSSGGAGGGASAPHHVIGNGTEGVVTGLSRKDAMAGIVSSVDLKAGLCEVILVQRKRPSIACLSPFQALRNVDEGSGIVKDSTSGHTMSVRAVRASLTDVVHADEIQLFLDDETPSDDVLSLVLKHAASTLCDALLTVRCNDKDDAMNDDSSHSTKVQSEDAQGTGGISLAGHEGTLSVLPSIVALRCAVVFLSDSRLLSRFLQNPSARRSLHTILKLSSLSDMPSNSPEIVASSRLESLASISVHEARLSHFISMLKELNTRRENVNSAELADVEKYLENKFEVKDETSKLSGGTKSKTERSEEYTTPPASHASMAALENTGDAPSRAEAGESAAVDRGTFGRTTEEDDESDAAATAASHLREAAIAQMAELGLPRSWSELALRRTGGTNIEAAVHFCLERGADMERLLAEERERERMMQRQAGGTSSRRRGTRGESASSNHLLRQLLEMGFPSRWCAEALAATRNNVDEALTWILTNGERLSAEDEGMEEEDDDDGDDEELEEIDDDEDSADDGLIETVGEMEIESNLAVDHEGAINSPDDDIGENIELQHSAEGTGADLSEGREKERDPAEESQVSQGAAGWCGSVTPLRFISGRSIINPHTLAVSGLPTGGFSSVGTKGILHTSGKWYYEAILETAGCLQIGWADGSFSGHCHADRGDGCGDGPSSWAYDGWRRYRWHASATEWGCRWKEGDVVGCLVDMDEKIVSFTLNGGKEEIGMGVAFSGTGFRPCGGVYACVSFNRKEKLRLILGGKGCEAFKYTPPPGYRGVGEAVHEAVTERDLLVSQEDILDSDRPISSDDKVHRRPFLCDFSDREHGHELFSWQHRYYGSDASVHLGSDRKKGGSSKSSRGGSSSESTTVTCVSQRVRHQWSVQEKYSLSDRNAKRIDSENAARTIGKGYEEVRKKVLQEIRDEGIALGVLYARKLVLHLMLSQNESFELGIFRPEQLSDDEKLSADCSIARKLWMVLEACTSLRSAGWGGEAGAMAVAAESLGLGISSTSSGHSHLTERGGVGIASELNGNVLVPAGGATQILSCVSKFQMNSIIERARDTSDSYCAVAETSIGGEGGGGSLLFLRNALQSAAITSASFRRVLVSAIRRSVRVVAVVDFSGDESASEGSDDEDSYEKTPQAREDSTDSDGTAQPDARLASFLTGLLLSKPVQNSLLDRENVISDLFEAWSVGLLSASSPWRMVCAMTVSSILNMYPQAFARAIERSPIIARFYGRLESTVIRRVWAERAAMPVCSRYIQSMIELFGTVQRCVGLSRPVGFEAWGAVAVDAATPLPILSGTTSRTNEMVVPPGVDSSWETEEGWVSSDVGWQVWTGTVEMMAVEWKTPSRSAVRTLMDGGDGPPMLREGCFVVRGLDWEGNESGSQSGNEDGKDQYEAEKAEREKEKKALDEEETEDTTDSAVKDGHEKDGVPKDSLQNSDEGTDGGELQGQEQQASRKKRKKKKLPNPKLPIGTVISIEPWGGIPAMARKVRWHLTGEVGIYRYGGDGGRFDIGHVEVNAKQTRIKKRHPLPESAEQCAARHGFGSGRLYNILLRLKAIGTPRRVNDELEYVHQGILEWPDFGAGIRVDCILQSDGAVTIIEKELLYGSKDSGWEARFGQASFVEGTMTVLSPTRHEGSLAESDTYGKGDSCSPMKELLGSSSYLVEHLRNRSDRGCLRVTSEMRLRLGRNHNVTTSTVESGGQTAVQSILSADMQPPFYFDPDFHASSLSLSRDGKTAICKNADGRGTAFASVGFTKGVHYWEVKLEQADIGSVFIGVAEKPNGSPSSSGGGSSYSFESQPRLNRWHGWGFVNFRATYSAGAERVYGAHCHAGDTVGVLLDCDAGRISFYFDGLKYGEHILNDLGCAFENISPFGFNADGCGSGGAGQGAPSGVDGGRGGRYPANGPVRPRSLWPVIGLRNPGDRVTLSGKWMTSLGVDGVSVLRNVLAVEDLLFRYEDAGFVGGSSRSIIEKDSSQNTVEFPKWAVAEAFNEYKRWKSGRWLRTSTRGSGAHALASFGLDVDLDASPLACAKACAILGLPFVLLSGDRVAVKRSAGRLLELSEEAIVLGVCHDRLYYRLVSQKSEGGSLMEGGGRAWFWDESEVVDGGLQLLGRGRGLGIPLPLLEKFKCTSCGGLNVVYEGGAVVRSDLEIFDGSANLGSIPQGTVILGEDVLERRVNSCGVVRYRVRCKDLGGEGWISSRIRGGKEEPIVEYVESDGKNRDTTKTYHLPKESALEWYEKYAVELVSLNAEDRKKLSTENGCMSDTSNWAIADSDEFEVFLSQGTFEGLSAVDSDSLLASAVSAVADYSTLGDGVECGFPMVASALSFAVATSRGLEVEMDQEGMGGVLEANLAAAAVFSSVGAPPPDAKSLLARAAFLRAFNRRARYALPWLSLRPCQEGSAVLGGTYGCGASIDRAGRGRLSTLKRKWVQAPSIASRIRKCRRLFFTSVKRLMLESIMDSTTTPTPLSHDEYELPREIRTVRINRLKARRAMASDDKRAKRKHSVFSQLQSEMKNWSGASLRRGFVAKGHGGQKRAFKIKLVGEGVNDYSGPYREVFTDGLNEIIEVDSRGESELGILEPSPNNVGELGEHRDLFVFAGKDVDIMDGAEQLSPEEVEVRNAFATLLAPRDEHSREAEEALIFLGRMAATACRHRIPVDLPLPIHSVWRAIVEENSDPVESLEEIDLLASRQQTTTTTPPSVIVRQHRMLNSFVEGMANVIPVEVLPLFTGNEVRDILCGNPEVDVALLRRVVEYEGYEDGDQVIEYFWDALGEMSNKERKLFLQFVWARSRLPMKESDFEAPFKIHRDKSEDADAALPSASTCFFTLYLPNYTSKETLKRKLLFSIENVCTMESDYVTNDAEVGEGWRGL